MKADFTRNSFNSEKQFYRVLMQQGRTQLDSDWNEQASILLYRMECIVRDLVGLGGGPGDSFLITSTAGATDFTIGRGRYYVDGLACENPADLKYSSQFFDGVAPGTPKNSQPYLVFLDAWEEFVSALQDPSISDPALLGADTAARSRVVWKVRLAEAPTVQPCKTVEGSSMWNAVVAAQQPASRGFLTVRTRDTSNLENLGPCITPPDARYRGAENQLYRVEIHDGGVAGASPGATFKWSRENGSVTTAVLGIKGDLVTIANFPQNRFSFQTGDWVELTDSAHPHQPLFKIAKVDAMRRILTLDLKGRLAPIAFDATLHPMLRRWDQKSGPEKGGGVQLADGVAPIREGQSERNWLLLEDGIEIQFQPSSLGGKNQYRSGDYWMFPARTANNGEVIWPTDDAGNNAVLPPIGTTHRYAPLAMVNFDNAGNPVKFDCRFVLPLSGQ